MKHVKVDATTSTNEMAKSLYKNAFKENFCISAEFQSSGKGQHHNTWESKKSKNLTFTVVLGNLQLSVDHRFYLNILVCNALIHVLKKYQLKQLSLKWPNDILSEQKKICGILIENTISRNLITSSFIGIGLNVNQEKFENLPHASSMKILLHKAFDRKQVLNHILEQIEKTPELLKNNLFTNEISNYKKGLLGYNTYTSFYYNQKKVMGKIIDVETSGDIKIEFEDGKIKWLNHSEIQQLY